ncbi:MAG TPA: MFS transporter [Desulfobulbaceae bacterium]|nr:MFS transporter [Desulfobulbaceae bacterium]
MGQQKNILTGTDRVILSVTCYGHFLCHFNMLVFPAILLPLSGLLQMSMADTLNLAFFMYLLMGLSAPFWGYTADKIGAIPLLALFYVGAGCSGLTAAFFIDSPVALKLALAGIGLFSGIYHPAGLGWIACCVSKTSTGMAYNGMFGNLGLALGPVLAGLVNYLFGPAAVYIGLALLNFFGLFLLMRAGGATRRAAHAVRENGNGASWSGFAILLVAMMLGGIVYRGATVTLPALFQVRGVGIFDWLSGFFNFPLSANVVATGITSFLYLVGMLGQYFGGRIGERFDLRWSYFCFHLLTVPAALIMGLLSDIPLVVLAIYHSFFLLGMQPIENTLVARLTPPEMHSSAYGMKFVLTFGVGAVAVLIVRHVEQAWGIQCVFPALGLISILLVLVIGVLIYKVPKQCS